MPVPQPPPGTRTTGGVFTDRVELANYLAYHEQRRKYFLAAWLLRHDRDFRLRFMERYLLRFPEDRRQAVRSELLACAEIVRQDWRESEGGA